MKAAHPTRAGEKTRLADRARRPPSPEATALQKREPALLAAFVVLVAAFFVQTAAGVEPEAALATALGISGVQGYLTRRHVYSPATVKSWYEPRD